MKNEVGLIGILFLLALYFLQDSPQGRFHVSGVWCRGTLEA